MLCQSDLVRVFLAAFLLTLLPACVPAQQDKATGKSSGQSGNTSTDTRSTDLKSEVSKVEQTTDELDQLLKTIADSGDNYERAFATARLIEFADEYPRFVKPLSKLLIDRDEVISGTAIRIFRHLGKKGVDAIEPELDSQDLEHLRQVCSAINAVGDPCEEYVPQLIELLRTEDDVFRRTAATFALTGFTDGCPDAIDLILRDLDHSDMNVTLFAIRLIIKTGRKSEQAIPQLVHLFENGVPSQRGYAVWGLAAIGPTDEFDIVEASGKMLNRFTVSERERGLIAVGLLGEAAKEFEPKIREMMNQQHSNLEGHAAIALWKIKKDPAESIEMLVKLSRDVVEYEVNGLKLIAEMGPAASPAIDFLIERMAADDASVQVAALDALRAIGPEVNDRRETIAKLAKSTQDPLIRFAATQVLDSLKADENE